VKRLLSLIVFFIAAAAAAQSVSVATQTGRCSQSVAVPVSIDAASGMLSLEFRIAFDTTALTVSNVSAGTLTSSFALSSNVVGNSLRIAMASGTPVSGSGTVANVTFTIGATATGNSPLTISNVLVNDVARSGASGAVTITCPQPPAAPANLSPANGARDVAAPVTLRWSAVSGATGYRVNFGTGPVLPTVTTTTATSHQVTTASGTTYSWQITALNADGQAQGPAWSFTTAGVACATPAAPSQIAAPAEVVAGAAFDVTWGAAANATTYLVEQASDASFAGATTTTVVTPRATFTKSAAGTFYYRVYGRNASPPCNVDGPYSAAVAVRVTARPPLPANVRVLPIAGSADGGFGSSYRTSVQLHNATDAPLRGSIVFHPIGSTGSDVDPSLHYDLGAGETLSYTDLVAALGIPRGLGSLDFVPEGSMTVPLSVVRIFNDAGANGTTGMTFDTLTLSDALQAGQRGVIVAPIDTARARMNIGIRTLLDGVSLTITVKDRHGAVIATSQQSYPATYLTQFAAASLAPLTGDEVLEFAVDAGSAIVYASANDNITQDPSVQIARPVQ